VSGYILLIPELLVVAGVFWALFANLLPGGDRGSAWVGAGIMAVATGIAVALPATSTGPFGNLLAFDGPARAARISIAALSCLWLLWTAGRAKGRVREAVALALLAVEGGMLMCGARELVTLFLSLELATLPAYVLIGYRRDNVRGLEGALKYFLVSMLTSLVMLYGFSFLYGISGTTRYAAFDPKAAGILGPLAVLLSLIGMLAKISAVPFHYWAPDAYSGSDAWTVAFVATVPKVAGSIAMLRLVEAVVPGVGSIGAVIIFVSAVSMILGNLAALGQTDVRRLMAYSGVARSGYMLLGVATLSTAGYAAALFYAVAYALPGMGVMLVAAEEGPLVSDFNGLAQRRPAVAWGVVIMLLSLIGMPPLVGFFSKFYLFSSAIRGNHSYLVVIALTMTVLSVGYYWRIVRAMFFGETSADSQTMEPSWSASFAHIACTVGVVVLGLFAGPVFTALGAFIR
jgi:NADH-quinone oxidoreductase subunit N